MLTKELWTVIHGMGFGALYLLGFTGGLADLWSFKLLLITPPGAQERIKRLQIGMWIMAVAALAAVVSGTYIVYPWYRERIPTSPRSILLADPKIAFWHSFGMEWKEHLGWICPILTIAVAFIITYYKENLIHQPLLRRTLLALFMIAFVSAGIAGFLGALITKLAPIH